MADIFLEDEILWGNNPNKSYFAYFLENQRNLRGNDSIMGNSTQEELIAAPHVQRETEWVQMANSKATVDEGDVYSRGHEKMIPLTPQAPDPSPSKKQHSKERTPETVVSVSLDDGRDVPSVIYVGQKPQTVLRRAKGDTSMTKTSFFEVRHNRVTVIVLLVILISVIVGFSTVLLVLTLRASAGGGPHEPNVPSDVFSPPSPNNLVDVLQSPAPAPHALEATTMPPVMPPTGDALVTQPTVSPVQPTQPPVKPTSQPTLLPTTPPSVIPTQESEGPSNSVVPTPTPLTASPVTASPVTSAPVTSLPTSVPPTFSPSTTKFQQLHEFLSSISHDQGASFANVSSPQFQALLWLSEATYLHQYTGYQKMQRFVLATLYLSTSGSTSWIRSDNWLTDADECTWYTGLSAAFSPCTADGRLTNLDLRSNGLAGTLPPELALLKDTLGKQKPAIDRTLYCVSI